VKNLGPAVEQSLSFVKQVFDVNVFSVIRMTKAVVPVMAKHNSGTIVNIGSVVEAM
jgi:1-acylglycerone phosphate reductase